MSAGWTPERSHAERQRALATAPRWYHPTAHVVATVSVGAVTLAVGAVALRKQWPSASDWLVVPLVAVLSNYSEWRLHKYVLHRRFWPLRVAYELHTKMHHMIYTDAQMTIRCWRELYMVLMPARFVVALVAGAVPFALLIGVAWSRPAGWLFLITASSCLVGYELLHLSYHLPEDGLVGRLRLIRILRAHHARHHDPGLMQRYNFNVTLPLFDWILGTMAPKLDAERVGDTASQRAAPP